jgi:transcriptional regulator with XRE-family HTH domain
MKSDITSVLGDRLRQMRKIHGQSLRDQAKLIGVSPSTLSELERGIAGISLQRLQLVAGALGVSVSDLLDGDRSHAPRRPLEIIRGGDQDEVIFERGRGVHYSLLGESGMHSLQPFRITFDAGAGYADDPISHPGEEFAYVIFGEVVLHLADAEHRLSQGSVARFSSEVPHAFSNGSQDNIAAIIGAATPPW